MHYEAGDETWGLGYTSNELLVALQTDPSVSYWLRDAATKLYQRDPIDALRDAELLVKLACLLNQEVKYV
tara:strand:+ start:1421 stop:1630 length:210 start_codon:yes stop_codon:yes gene_type:complete